METFSALLAICAGNSPVTGEFPAQRPVTRSFDAFFDLHPNKRLSKRSWGWWFETPSRPLWRHCNDMDIQIPWIYWERRRKHTKIKSTTKPCIYTMRCTTWLIPGLRPANERRRYSETTSLIVSEHTQNGPRIYCRINSTVLTPGRVLVEATQTITLRNTLDILWRQYISILELCCADLFLPGNRMLTAAAWTGPRVLNRSYVIRGDKLISQDTQTLDKLIRTLVYFGQSHDVIYNKCTTFGILIFMQARSIHSSGYNTLWQWDCD